MDAWYAICSLNYLLGLLNLHALKRKCLNVLFLQFREISKFKWKLPRQWSQLLHFGKQNKTTMRLDLKKLWIISKCNYFSTYPGQVSLFKMQSSNILDIRSNQSRAINKKVAIHQSQINIMHKFRNRQKFGVFLPDIFFRRTSLLHHEQSVTNV